MNGDHAVQNLVYLLKWLPVMQELESVDRIYRFLLAVVTAGRSTGFERAMLFTVDDTDGMLRGRFGVVPGPIQPELGEKQTFEKVTRHVFGVYENIDISEATLRARTFSVPLDWHRSALVKAARAAYPVLAERELSEFSTDPFLEFFDADGYLAVPIRFNDRVMAVLSADTRRGDRPSVEGISLLYSLCQQAAAAAQHLVDLSEHRRRLSVLWKLNDVLSRASDPSKFDEALRLALIMLTRAVGASGCALKDLVQQKTVHIKSSHEHSAGDHDAAIGESMEEILDRTSGRVESIDGDHCSPLLTPAAASGVEYFFSCPLVASGEVAGALAVYTAPSDNEGKRKDYKPDDRSFVELCAGVLASRIEGLQKDDRVGRAEELLDELSANLAREREHSRVGELGAEFFDRVVDDTVKLRAQLSSKLPFSQRFPAIRDIVNDVESHVASYRDAMSPSESHFEMIDVFDLAREMPGAWKQEAEKKGIDVVVNIPPDGPDLLMDKSKIATALESILSATVSCLEAGNTLMFECKATDDRVLICIADNGEGIPGDAITRLFMPFEQVEVHDERKRALSLAGEIFQKHAGEIVIKSSFSWKTILVLSFPIAANRDRRKTRAERRRGRTRRVKATAS